MLPSSPVFGTLPLSFRYSGLPGAVVLPNLGAAYPTSSATYPTANCGATIVDGNYDCASVAARTPPEKFSGDSIFGANRQVPPQPNAASGTVAGFAPMLPGMTQNLPGRVPRALWFRTTEGTGDTIGITSRTRYDRDRALLIYNHSWPSISSSGSNLANLNTPGRLVLPDTVCIDTATGGVDARCQTGTTSLINLNLPANPHYPSTNTSATGTAATRPASSYAICGVNGVSQNYQSRQVAPSSDITGGSCPTNNGSPRGAIATAMGTTANGFRNNNLDPESPTFRGQGSTVVGFVSPAPIVTGQEVGGNKLITIEAANTYEINKVNVINLTGLDTSVSPPTGVWNQACPVSNQTTPKTISGILRLKANPNQPSPVFVLRSCSTQDLALDSLKLQLDGVEPNNVFWVVPRTNAAGANARALTITTSSPDSANVVTGGSGYAIGDVLTVTGGSGTATQLTVSAVSTGAITAVTVSTPGSYTSFPANPVTVTGGGGAGATFNLNSGTVLSGNFLGFMPATGTADRTQATTLNIKNTAASPSANISLRSARFLGFRAFSAGALTAPNPGGEGSDGVDSLALVSAMTTTDQPIVLPVLQLHSPTANAAGGSGTMPQPNLGGPAPINNSLTGEPVGTGSTGQAATGQWLQRATDSEINVYFVAGITPSRSKVAYTTSIAANSPNFNTAVTTAETGGGLHNFIRLIENWTNRNLTILGGFIQNTRSSLATSPFSVTAPYGNAVNSFDSSDTQTLFINPVDNIRATQSLSNFRKEYQSETTQKLPYYAPPNRLWGFDVGLLTQAADRFAERFATPIPGANEFLREVDGNDPWVKALLCAAQPGIDANTPFNDLTVPSPTNPGAEIREGTRPDAYKAFALGAEDRPAGCDPLDYN